MKKSRVVILAVAALLIAAFAWLLLAHFNLAKVVLPGKDVTIDRISVVESVVDAANPPKTYNLAEREACAAFLTCLQENYGHWRFFSRDTIVQNGGTLYDLTLQCSGGETVTCLIFDGKLYCGAYAYALAEGAEESLTGCLTKFAAG